MKSLLVVGSSTHGVALKRWLRLDDAQWDVALYGDVITTRYARAMLARPVGDITDDHAVWVGHVLAPMIAGPLEPQPGWGTQFSRPVQIADLRDERPHPRALAV